MSDAYIFGFGLTVTILVGSGLATMIIANNRAIEAEKAKRARDSEVAQPVPVPSSATANRRG